MVEKVITSLQNVVDFARYQAGRNAVGNALPISTRLCRHCGAVLADGENEDECSGAIGLDAASLHGGSRKFRAD